MKNIRRYTFPLLFSAVLAFALSACASQLPNEPKKATRYQKSRKSIPQWNTTKSTTTKYIIKDKSKSKNPQY